MVLCSDRDQARRVARAYQVSGRPLEKYLTIAEAAGAGQFLHEPLILDNYFLSHRSEGVTILRVWHVGWWAGSCLSGGPSCIGDTSSDGIHVVVQPNTHRGSGPDCQSSWRQFGECDRRDPTDGWGFGGKRVRRRTSQCYRFVLM